MSKFIAMVILKPDIQESQIDFIQSNIIRLFDEKTKVQKIWYLGKRKLDQKIKKYDEGFYIKLDVSARPKRIEQIKQELRKNENIIFSIIINNECSQNNLSAIKRISLPVRKAKRNENITLNNNTKKVYMLISKNLKLPFTESDIIAISENENSLYQLANKKIQEYVFAKGYHTLNPFKNIKDTEKEFKRNGKVEFTIQGNLNTRLQLYIKEQTLMGGNCYE